MLKFCVTKVSHPRTKNIRRSTISKVLHTQVCCCCFSMLVVQSLEKIAADVCLSDEEVLEGCHIESIGREVRN